jgi:hypothetical protein
MAPMNGVLSATAIKQDGASRCFAGASMRRASVCAERLGQGDGGLRRPRVASSAPLVFYVVVGRIAEFPNPLRYVAGLGGA